MKPIDDERVLFYLRHQHRIDEWSALREDAWEAMHHFLCSLRGDVEALATMLNARFFENFDEGDTKLFLHAPDWLRDTEPYPLVAIGVEWQWWDNKDRKPLGFTVQKQCPFVGVWVNQEREGGSDLSKESHRVISRQRVAKATRARGCP